ncbi:MAG TPA: hypothetical protein ENN17_05325 [bacterium]|nr:hypothetical protein [bacterium]
MFKIAICVLAIALIGTILYPKTVWQKENALESVCRARMDAINHLELQYINLVLNYTDSLDRLKEVVLADDAAIVAIDSAINWNGLTLEKNLKPIVYSRPFPESLRNLITTTLTESRSLRNLTRWDSLGYKLIAALEEKLDSAGTDAVAEIDTGIVWTALFGNRLFQSLVENAPIPMYRKSRMRQELRRGIPVHRTRDWGALYPLFYEKLSEIIETATRSDIWDKADQDTWKKMKRAAWEADMDTLSTAQRDSLWMIHEKTLWDKTKEVVWRQESRSLWKKEKDTWPAENEALWRRNISQQWELDRKKQWIDNQEKSQPTDSALVFFKANRDSLWRTVSDSIRHVEYADWERNNKKHIEDIIEALWQSDRRVEWEDDAHRRWNEQKSINKAARWVELKEELWNTEWIELWKQEEEKNEEKQAGLRALDLAVKWDAVLGRKATASIVRGLSLPEADTVWRNVSEKTDEKGSGLYRYGIVGLFRGQLIDSLDLCPVAKTPYLIQIVDTAAIKKFSIRCPIEETRDLSISPYKFPIPEFIEGETGVADTLEIVPPKEETDIPKSRETHVVTLVVDPSTKDTSKVKLHVPAFQKIFGGASIRSHGMIDEDGKKSWEQIGR